MNKSIAEAVGSTMQTGVANYIATGRPTANDHYGWRHSARCKLEICFCTLIPVRGCVQICRGDCYFFYRATWHQACDAQMEASQLSACRWSFVELRKATTTRLCAFWSSTVSIGACCFLFMGGSCCVGYGAITFI